MLSSASLGLGIFHDPAEHTREIAEEVGVYHPAQVWLEVMLQGGEHELPVDCPLDVPLGKLLGARATQFEVAPEGTISRGAALAAGLDNDGLQAKSLGDLLQGSGVGNDILQGKPERYGGRPCWCELLEGDEELVSDARDHPEEDT